MANTYIDRLTGLAVTVADGVELPAALYRRAGTAASSDLPKRDVLVAQAERLGIEVPSKATKHEIAALIDEFAIGATVESEAAREAVPAGVAPGTPVESGVEGTGSDAGADTPQDANAGTDAPQDGTDAGTDTAQGNPADAGE